MLHGYCYPLRGEAFSLLAIAEALRVRFEQALFLLSLCFAPKQGSAEVSEIHVLTEV